MSSFKFKHFEILQGKSAMKVNTDGVLLGAWVSITGAELSMLDVGTGTGVIAIMAAQRHHFASQTKSAGCRTTIRAIDIDPDSLDDARHNISRCGFCSDTISMETELIAFQEMRPEVHGRYDLIFSNPPYFINSLKSADAQRTNARHTDTLEQGEFIQAALKLLNPGGKMALILPVTEGEQLLSKISFIGKRTPTGVPALHLHRLCKVHTTIKKPAKRWLIEFVLSENAPDVEYTQLVIMNDGEFSPEYRTLTGDFYLKF